MKIATLVCLLAVSVQAQALVPHSYRIDDHVYGGRQPRPADYAGLARMGIKTVLDLRGGPIHKPHERKQVEALGMHYVSIRLSGLFPPREWQIEKIMAVLENPANTPVFIHCRRGADRVGMVIACYRMVHDHWSNQRALAEAKQHHINILEVLMRRYIRKFDASRVERAMTSGPPVLTASPGR